MIRFKQSFQESPTRPGPNALMNAIQASIIGASGTSAQEPIDNRRVSRWMAAALVMLSVSFGAALFYHHSGQTSDAPMDAACAAKNSEAVERLVALVRGNTDTDLRQTADAIFRIRRARRNCLAGFMSLADSDYRALLSPVDQKKAD
jgi:hypothetical protein